jgi:glycosyltransferase involved in cell wall biosynthesis
MAQQDPRISVYRRNLEILSRKLAPQEVRDPRIAVYQRNLDRLAGQLCDAQKALGQAERELKRRSAELAKAQAPQEAGRFRQRAAVVCGTLAGAGMARAQELCALLEGAWEAEIVGLHWGAEQVPPAETAETAEPGADLRIRSLSCASSAEFHHAALALALGQSYELVIVCCSDLPGLMLGGMLQSASVCPVILDIAEPLADAQELPAPDEADERRALDDLQGEAARRLCARLIADFPARIVASRELGRRHGGIVVRHARDARSFDPAYVDRGAARRALGLNGNDFALAVLDPDGAETALAEIAEAVQEMQDDRIALHVIGGTGDSERLELLGKPDLRIVLHPDAAAPDRALMLAAVDAAVVPVRAEMPGGETRAAGLISEAAAFGLPVLVEDAAQLRELVDLGVAAVWRKETLRDQLATLAARRTDAAAIRSSFLTELSQAINRPRLDMAIEAAQGPLRCPAALERLLEMAARSSAPASPVVGGAGRPDIVMFWKQNDSGLYGRRSDMLMKHLLASGRVGRVLQFDAPYSLDVAARLAQRMVESGSRHERMVMDNLLADQFGRRDTDRHLHRTFLWSEDASYERILPRVAGSELDFTDFVLREMSENGFDPANSIAWICPVVPETPTVVETIPFRGVVGDLIDDQRMFAADDQHLERLQRDYEEILPKLDLALTNCVPMAEAFAPLAHPIHVVPNGVELHDPASLAPHPDLQGYRRPRIGYVGHLRDRIDWTLLAETARRRPEWSFVLVGPGLRSERRNFLADYPNIHVHGAVTYEEIPAVIESFEVAIVPHEVSARTERMNPLKIYAYVAGKRPVVATPLANIDSDIAPLIRFADTPEAFVARIDEALEAGPDSAAPDDDLRRKISWDSRTAAILALLEQAELLEPGERPCAAEHSESGG